MIQRMADKDKSDYATARQKLMGYAWRNSVGASKSIPSEVAELVAFPRVGQGFSHHGKLNM